AHAPDATPSDVLAASPLGRPPFGRRPVVLFAACAAVEPQLEDRLRDLVNELVEHDVEARLAVPAVRPGRHLTRPCSPSQDSFRALVPDVVVTLDAGAAGALEQWAVGNRTTVRVELDPEASGIRVVPWRIGVDQGRLRGAIGPDADAATVMHLVSRLCAGPHVVAPGRRPSGPVVVAPSAGPVRRPRRLAI